MTEVVVSGEPTILRDLRAPLVTRELWDAPPSVGWPIEYAPIRGVVVHHSATANDDSDPMATVHRLHRFHAHTRGWGDIGYSFLVIEDGRILEGREGSASAIAPFGVVAGHAYGHNVGTVGIAIVGRFHHQPPTDAAWSSLVDLVAAVSRTCGLDPEGGPVKLTHGAALPRVISGHRDARDTSCPGDALTKALPVLRAAVATRLD